ncbi:hypothetical protein [Deinococcus ruber]|uniref:Uncharacterized protein n=1 Tax=Deinococcus ruber TaxID=1848197 RepID=A0A918FIW3_9DEIO|nr:hypothetical protein [Deinococcus ruber]GGR41529.1 hypothetical protein GCM10008957_56740 [Deinococcus ruber]
MRHIAFPTEQAATAFQQDLIAQGLATPDTGRALLTRRSDAVAADLHGGTPEDAGVGAIKGTEAGLAVGAVAGVLTTTGVLGAAAATAATVATGGLALPIILGMAALGAGVGAAVGGVGGAAGVDETHGAGQHTYEVDHGHYDDLSTRVSQGEQVLAVDDAIPTAVLDDTVRRHGGHLI